MIKRDSIRRLADAWVISIVRGVIHLYRGVVSPLLTPACRFYPSCSHYALQALTDYGLLQGGWYILKRLLRCRPWGGQGYDPLPSRDATMMNKERNTYG